MALVTTGPALDPGAITAPPNVDRRACRAALARCWPHAAAVVTHGGHGTVVRALAAGVPMVVLPHGRDQADNAVRVTARGAGIKLSRGAKPQRIAKAVQRVLANPDMRLNAEQLGEAVRRDAAAGRLVAELETAPTTAPAAAPCSLTA